MTKITIPTDADRVLLVSNIGLGLCSLFINGKRERMFQLDREDDNTIQVSLTVKKLAQLAGVVLIQGVDPRVLMRDPEELPRKRRWYETLAEAAARHAELVEAAALKAKAAADLKRAEQLEAAR